ncbi:MAG: 6-bladed beta-propeller [Gemmatimonadota bacterium]|nr:MAG: 6-bladed beta-propeller [Gemmatimonadota bacterium]
MLLDQHRSLAAVAASLCVMLAACRDSGSTPATERADSSGIEIVTHRGPDAALDWGFEVAFTLGGKETGEESFYRIPSGYVAVDAEHSIYVLDRASNRVVVFDSSGAFVRTMGSEGGGPGEMRFPFALGVSPAGVVSVFDISKRGLVRFAADGAVLDEMRITFPYGGGVIVDRGESMIIPSQQLDTEQSTFTDELLSIAGEDTLRLVSNVRQAGGSITLESCGMRLLAMTPIFAPEMRWTPVEGGIAVVTSAGYEVALYRDDRIVRVVRRPIDPMPATREAALEELGEGMRVAYPGGVRVCDNDEVVEQRGFADVIPVIDELGAGPRGSLWIKRSSGGPEPGPIDVFEEDGTYRGTLSAGSPFPIAVLGDRIAAVQADESDVERLVVYRIVR